MSVIAWGEREKEITITITAPGGQETTKYWWCFNHAKIFQSQSRRLVSKAETFASSSIDHKQQIQLLTLQFSWKIVCGLARRIDDGRHSHQTNGVCWRIDDIPIFSVLSWRVTISTSSWLSHHFLEFCLCQCFLFFLLYKILEKFREIFKLSTTSKHSQVKNSNVFFIHLFALMIW